MGNDLFVLLESHFQKELIEAGLDEAGRGCLAGPVVAAAVVFPKDYVNEFLNDSKQLSKKKREILFDQIQKDALAFAIAEVWNEEIDQINILNASFLAMHRALDKLEIKPQLLIIDGNRFNPYPSIPHECIIKGDGKFLAIAAASILAKTHRDRIMENLHIKHPEYGWCKNAGYPTKQHRLGIAQYGITSYHRKSFNLLPNQLGFGF